ncbi:hypothetical protein DJFAAGMI_01857 [Comamonas sp. PE63]|uniref:Uncharacterized protein n=1 Tax=Comamonas brasiliensis TaxID=1812482 RepID=A0ABS5LRI7_9BURK|nr:hypothetical protein [Comamonas sp. PE63]MBS3019118.1 hypothetical protein [Comamonas sp. PE63]
MDDNKYSLHTLEHVPADTPAADWMGAADGEAPAYNRQTHGCFWREGAWELVEAKPYLPPAPDTCTRRQGLLALLSLGIKRAAIEALIDGVADEDQREAALIEYEAATWERTNPFLQEIWRQLGRPTEALDDLFRLAITL